MRTWMIILLVLSCLEIRVTFSDGKQWSFSWLFPLIALILFCTNY